MCEGCPLQTLADHFPKAMTRVVIWHEREGKPDMVQVSIVRDSADDLVVTAPTCREAVAELLREMNQRDCGPAAG
jgi:hypothetical protein